MVPEGMGSGRPHHISSRKATNNVANGELHVEDAKQPAFGKLYDACGALYVPKVNWSHLANCS